MKLSCTQENLNQGLMVVSHIAAKNTNLPILSNVLVSAEDKILTLSSTNLEIGITASVRGKIENEGSFTVEAKLFSNYISLLPKERIDLELDGDELKVFCQKQKTKIKGQAAADFPLIPKIRKENPYLIKTNEFKEAILKVIFAAATSEIRPEISGILINITDQEIIFAATDTYRLAEKKIKLISEADKNPNIKEKRIIVPVKTLQEVSRILSVFKEDISIDNIENTEIYLTENQLMVSYNSVDLTSRVIEGQYPDYTQIIPSDFKSKIKINTSELVKAVKTASLFAKSGIYDIKLDFSSDKKEMVITSSSSQTGENISQIEVSVEGDGGYIVLNYRYLLDGLQNINAENIIIEANDPNSLCIIRPEKEENYFYMIMPIRQE